MKAVVEAEAVAESFYQHLAANAVAEMETAEERADEEEDMRVGVDVGVDVMSMSRLGTSLRRYSNPRALPAPTGRNPPGRSDGRFPTQGRSTTMGPSSQVVQAHVRRILL